MKHTHAAKSQRELQRKRERELQMVRGGVTVADHIAHGRIDKAFKAAITSGIKLSSESDYAILRNPHSNPILISKAMFSFFGSAWLTWKPETLASELDKKINSWSDEKIAVAMENFHDKGEITSDVTPLMRQKLYALRILHTSDALQSEWHVFEKSGCVFCDRLANFTVIERLSPAECARTIAIIESIRPDFYADEVKIYIAASANVDGVVTLEPSKYLKMSDKFLQIMNKENVGAASNNDFPLKISERIKLLKAGKEINQEDPIDVQAAKIMVIDKFGEDAENGL